jgi:predicted CXXCH cytochrome family protein
MIAKRLLVGLVALGLTVLAVSVVESPSAVRAQQQPPFPVPHGDYSADTDTCRVCHAWHTDEEAGVFPNHQLLRVPNQPTAAEPDELDVCFACHDGSAAETNVWVDFTKDGRASSHPVLAPRNDRTLVCSDCHAEHQDPEEDVRLLYREMSPDVYVFSPPSDPIGDTFCYGCHGSDSTLPAPFGDHALFETSIHATDGDVEPPTPGTDLKCSTCHEPHASDYAYLTRANQEDLCYTCHSGADPNTANGSNPQDDFTSVANDYATNDGNGIRIYHHPIAEAEQANGSRALECASCHNSHLVNRTETANDPARARAMDSGWRFLWEATSGGYNRSANAAAFCATCHVNPTTTAPLTASTDVSYDVRLVNDAANDADGTPHDTFSYAWFTGGAKSAHGNPSFVSTRYLGCPPGQACTLACTACHDFHGSSNAFMLRETIVSPDYRPLAVTDATWANAGGGTATLTVGAHGMARDWIVTVTGVTPAAYNGTWSLTSVTATTVSFRLNTNPGSGGGGTVATGGPENRPTTASIVNYGGLDTASDRNKLQTFCLTCHLEQRSNHQGGKLCTECHNHSTTTQREF